MSHHLHRALGFVLVHVSLLLVHFGSRCQQGVVALCGVFLIVPCVTRQDVVVLSWYGFQPPPLLTFALPDRTL